MVGIDAGGQRFDHVIWPEVQEERHRIARAVGRLTTGIYHAMGGRAQLAVGQPVEHIADIDYQRTFGRCHGLPFALGREKFQTSLFRAQQKRDGVDVAVRRCTDRTFGFLAFERRIAQQAHDRIAVFDGSGKKFARQAQVKRDTFQHPPASFLERRVKLGKCLAETVDFIRPDVVGHVLCQIVALGKLAPDMPEFFQVARFSPLGVLFSKGGIPPLASYALNSVATRHKLPDIARYYLNISVQDLGDLLGKGKNKLSPDAVELEKFTSYAAEKADLVLRLSRLLERELADNGHLHGLYKYYELPLVKVLQTMERNGIRVDEKSLAAQSEELGGQLEKLQGSVYALAGEEFNVGSPKQLQSILY